MSDEPRKFKKIGIEAEHVPEQHFTRNTDGSVTEQTLPGQVTVYLTFDGGRVPFTTYDAGRVLEAIDAAKSDEPAEPAEPADTAA